MFYEPEVRRERDRLSPIFKEFLSIAEAAGPLTATELLNAWAELDLLRAKTLAGMTEFPVLLCPVAGHSCVSSRRARLDDRRQTSGLP